MLEYTSFKMSVAVEYGDSEAIFLNNIVYWLEKNASNGKHFHDGRYWTYNSIPSFTRLFPCWSIQNVRTIIKKLRDTGVLLTGNYNEIAYDKTMWYSLSDDFIKKHYPDSGILDHSLIPTDDKVNFNRMMSSNSPTYTKTLTQNTKQKEKQQQDQKIVVDESPPPKRYNTEKIILEDIVIPQGLKEEIDNKIGEITTTALKALLSTAGEKKIREKLDNWDSYAVTRILNCVGFFISAVNNDYPIPVSQNLNGYVSQKHNYKQRKYDDDFYESLYEHNNPGWGDLSKIDINRGVKYNEIGQDSL